MTTKINPNAPKPEHKPYLALLFKQQHGTIFWSAAKYVITTDTGPIEIQLTYPIVSRESTKENGGLRYDVSSYNLLGSGSFGHVYASRTTLKIDEQGELEVKNKKPDEERAIKMMLLHRHDKSTAAIIQEAMDEFELCQATPHIHPKKPVWNNTHIFIVMRRLSGQELYQILINDSGRGFLSILKRFKITFAVIDALQYQIFNCGLVHCDLKPENIIIKIIDDMIEAFLIDMGYAKRMETKRLADDVGSPSYVPPEVLTRGGKTNQLSDVYSLGRILALIWRVNPVLAKYNEEKHSSEAMLAWIKNSDYSSLFTGIDLNKVAKFSIQAAIETMLSFKPDERIMEHPVKINGKSVVNLAGVRKEFEDAYNAQFPASESSTVSYTPFNKTNKIAARRSLDQITVGRLNPKTPASQKRSSLTDIPTPASPTAPIPTPSPDFLRNNSVSAGLRSSVKKGASKIKTEIKSRGKEASSQGKKLLNKAKKAGSFFLGTPKEKRKSAERPPSVESDHNSLPPD